MKLSEEIIFVKIVNILKMKNKSDLYNTVQCGIVLYSSDVACIESLGRSQEMSIEGLRN